MTYVDVYAFTSRFSANGATLLTLLVAAVLGIIALCTLYLLKSALGINVFAGHLPVLHALLYPIVRG
jgi:hypothetical protein